MNIFAKPHQEDVMALLRDCALPTEDLKPSHFANFFGCGLEDDPGGIVGIEMHGSVALLRSLAVRTSCRGNGCAKELIMMAEMHAGKLGAQEIYLLTNTAEGLFASQGYSVIARDKVPSEIKETTEFSSICPDNATVMVKKIAA